MLKKILLSSLLIVTLSEAEESFSSERFLGIEVGYSSTDAKNVINNKIESNDIEYGLRVGAQNEEWRTTFALNYFKDGGQSYKKVMLEFDHFVWDSFYKTDNIVFKPYLGAHIGYMQYSDDNGQIDETGVVYGGQAGLTWNVMKEVEFDISYRYSVTGMTYLTGMSNVVFGVNYIY